MLGDNQADTTPQQPTEGGETQLKQVPSTTTEGSNLPPLVTHSAKMPPLQQAVDEFNKAVMRAAEYEGNIENIIRDKVNRLFPTADKALKEKLVAQAVEKVAEANQAFEFNHLGNDLLEFPAVEYMSMSFARRILEHLAIAQAKDPSMKIAKTNEDAGIGFLQGWSSDDVEWAKQLNAVLNEGKINARVLTSLAYSYLGLFRDPTRLHKMGEAVNQQLLTMKESNPRLNIFEFGPKISEPITTQPHGWPWLKYAGWHATEEIGHSNPIDFIGNRQDSHKGTGFKFQGMQQAIKPAPYRRDSFSLSERPEHESGYGGYVIHNTSLTSTDTNRPVSVNWRQQNMDKKLPMFAGPSSTTSYMYEIARLLNLPTAEAQAFRALLLGWMIQARDHSFTEIMGALDAYAMEFDEHGQAVVPSDEKMAWRARQTGDWLRAYESLVTEDIDLPGMEAKTIILNGQEIHLPALEPVKISREAFDQFITRGKGYPSYYASDEFLLKLSQAIQRGQDVDDDTGLASEKILYAPQDPENLKLYNLKERVLPGRPTRTESGTPLLDEAKDAAVAEWLDKLPPEKRARLLSCAASLLAESAWKDSLVNVFHYGDRNDVWETFLTVKETNMLAGRLILDSLKSGDDPFIHLLDLAAAKNTPQERTAAILAALGDIKSNQDILIKGMMLAVTRFYTANGANVINPGYGDFAPPKSDAEIESRLQSMLKKNQYLTSAQRAQAKSEYNQIVELLQASLESPLFERYSGTVWHGCHVATADALQEKGSGFKFPGFMSTTYDPGIAQSYMAKGALLVVHTDGTSGSMVGGISNAPDEKEILFPADTLFKVERSYTIHIEKGYPPDCDSAPKKAKFDLKVKMGISQPHVTVRVTTPEMDQSGVTGQSDPAGERELAELIEQIKKNSASMEPRIKVLVLHPEGRTSEEWRLPDTTKLTKKAVDAEETSFGYTRQLIVQIQDGDTVFDAANALFDKHPRQSEWVQLKNGQLHNLLGWDSATHQVRLLDTPLSLDSTGHVRLVLVGLGTVDEAGVSRFGGKMAPEWLPILQSLLDQFPANKIKGLRLDLVGCNLVKQDSGGMTLPGQLASWLADQAKERHWEEISVCARGELISVDSSTGQKWVYIEPQGWISSKDAEQSNIKYKSEWTWDARSQQLIESMGSTHKGNDDTVKQPREKLGERPHLGDANSKEQMAREVSLRSALLTLDAEKWGAKFDKAIIKLAQKRNLDQRWMPVIANTESLGEGRYRIQFINREQPTEIQWVDTQDATFAEFRSFIDERLRIMGQHFSLEQGQLRRQSSVGEVDSVDGLNAAFALQALIQWFANKNRADAATGASSPDLTTALTVHCYLNYVQMAHGGVQDVAKITELVRTALRGELVAAETSFMQFSSTLAHVANEGLGVILNGAMVGLDIYELAHAETETQKAVFATQLAFDSASLVTGVAAVTAGLLGASAVAAALSGPLVIIAGLAVSFTALAQAYGAVADDAQKVGRYFDMLDKAYKGGGFKYDDKQDMMVSLPGAVVKCLDLRNNQVDFDSQYIYRTTSSKTGSGKVGSGESNYFFWGGCPDIVYDRSQAIEVRSGIGYKEASHRLDHGNSKIVILPGTPKSFIKYEYQTLPGATLRGDTGFEVLRRLEKDYRFDYDFYTFPSEYIVRLIHQEYVATTIDIILDQSSRQLVVPKLPPEFYNQLHYEIKGAGGEYLISLNKGSTVRLTSDAPGSRWIIDSSQLDIDSISVSKGQVVIGGVRVDFDLTQHERLLVVNKQGEVREIDVVALTAQVVSEDASKWQRPGQNIEQHLAELAKAHQLHGQYVVVENYQHNGRNVGRAFYDVARNRMLFSDAALEQTRNALLGAVMGDHAYFYDADNATAWRAEIATGKIDAQFEPWFNQNMGKISRLWQEGDAIYLTRRYQLKSGEAELSYQLHGDQMELASVMGDDALLQRLARTGQQGDTLKELLRFYETDGIRRETPVLTPGGKLVQPTGAALITVFGTDANGVAHRYWIRTSDGTLIKPNLALPADHNLRFGSNDKVHSAWPIPADLVLAGSIPAPSGVEVFFFYSKEQKALFRQEGPGQSVLDASHPGALRINTPKLASLLNMNGSIIAITEDGRIASLDVQGHLNYCAVNEHWLKGRIHWWQDLDKVTDSDTPLAVFGVKGGDGTSVLTVWYHKGQVAIASGKLQGKALPFLGFEMGGASARFFEPESGKLYLQPTMTASQLVAAFGSDQTLDTSAQLPAASALLPELHLKAAQQVDTGLRLTTVKGETLLRTDGGNLQLVGVDRDWQQENQLRLADALSELATQWQAKGVLSFLLSNGEPGWFDIDSGQVFSGKGIPSSDSLRFVGVATDRKAAFVFNPVTHSLYKISKGQPDVLNMFAGVKRLGSTLLLQGGNEDAELIVDGVDTLVLYGGDGSDTYRLSKAMWQHYTKVVIDNDDPEQALDRLILPVEKPESMLMSRLKDDLQLTDFDTGKTLVIRQVFGSQASAYQHMLIEFPGHLPTVTVGHLVKNYIKQGDSWMSLGQAASKLAPQVESMTGNGQSSVELLRQAMCSLSSAGEGGSESPTSPTVLAMPEQPSLTLPI